MKIALTMEATQASRNALVYETLEKVAEKYGHSSVNCGPYEADAPYQVSYNQQALLNAILLNGKAVDFVVTGCGTGMGAMIASNAFPGVQCGFIVDPLDAKLVGEINYVNAISTPFAKGFGWGGEVNLEMMFEQLFMPKPAAKYIDSVTDGLCVGYKKELDYTKCITHKPIMEILEAYEKESMKVTLGNKTFLDYFYANCQNDDILRFVKQFG